MLTFGVIVLLTVFVPPSLAKTCTVCKTEYGAAKTKAASDKAAKCNALATYLTCLEGSGKGDAGCPPEKSDTEVIGTDFADTSCDTVFTDTCKCQKEFWKTDQKTGGDTAICRALQDYVGCLEGKTSTACDGTTTAASLTTGVQARITGPGTACVYLPPSSAKTCTACKSDYDKAKKDGGSDNKLKCSALATYLTCLEGSGKGDAGCPPEKSDAEVIGTDFADTSCDTVFTDTCKCQKEFWKTDQKTGGDTAICRALQDYVGCLEGKTSTACDGTTTAASLTTGVQARITGPGTACVYLPPSSAKTCTACKSDYDKAKKDGGSDNKLKCSALATYLTCLEGSGKGDAGCPPEKSDAEVIGTDFADTSCDTVFTDTCKCQKEFWKTDQKTGGDTAICRALQDYVGCLEGKTSTACDGTTTAASLTTGVQARITGPGTACVYLPPSSAKTCTACKSDYDKAKKDGGSDNKLKCSALGTYLTCLEGSGKSDAGCPPEKADAEAIGTDFADASCDKVPVFTDTCTCQKEFWKTDQKTGGDTAICSASKAYVGCLEGSTDKACDGAATAASLTTGVQTRITGLGTACGGNLADHVTYSMTSLIAPVLLRLFM